MRLRCACLIEPCAHGSRVPISSGDYKNVQNSVKKRINKINKGINSIIKLFISMLSHSYPHCQQMVFAGITKERGREALRGNVG